MDKTKIEHLMSYECHKSPRSGIVISPGFIAVDCWLNEIEVKILMPCSQDNYLNLS